MRWKLVVSFGLVVILAMGAVLLAIRRSTALEVRAYLFGSGSDDIEELTSILQGYYVQNRTWDGVEQTLRGAIPRDPEPGRPGMSGMMGTRVLLADENRYVVFDSQERYENGSQLKSIEISNAINLVDSNGNIIGYLITGRGLGFQRGDEVSLIRRLNSVALRAGLLALGIALVVALIFAETLTKSIRQLTRAAQKMQSGDLNQQVQIHGRDEMAQLGMAFNGMATSLRSAEERRKIMTADIAHELRTPLAVQRAHLEAIQDGIYNFDKEHLQPVLDQNELLTRLVDDLRTLALADAGELVLKTTRVDIVDLVGGVGEQFRASANNKQINLIISTNDLGECFLNADPDRLAQVMNNLLSNAIRHTPEGGNVWITLERDISKGVIQVEVKDSGPGIPMEEVPYIFERFYRADRSRSRDEGGTGLGLAIARQIALAHGGNLFFSNAPGGGATFTLSIPLQ